MLMATLMQWAYTVAAAETTLSGPYMHLSVYVTPAQLICII